jgi:hypothetical protein
MTEIDLNLSSAPGSPLYYLSDDIVLLVDKRVSSNKYFLLCINYQKLIDISHILDSNLVGEIKDNTNIRSNGMWCCIFHENIFCKVKTFCSNGIFNIEIIHYDINNNMKEVNKMNIQSPFCVSECVNHSYYSCTLKDGQEINPEICIQNIGDFSFVVGLCDFRSNVGHAGSYTPKHNTNYIFNIRALNKKIVYDGYFINNSFYDYIVFRSSDQLIIYNHLTTKELVLKYDDIGIHINASNKYLFGYTYNKKFKYIMFPKINRRHY